MKRVFPMRAGWLLAAFALSAATLSGGATVAGPALTVAELRVNRLEEEVFLFALRLDDATLSNTFPGFPVKDGFLVPLGELCRLLDLAIQTDPGRGRAEGFFVDEKRHFRLDVLTGSAVVEGHSQGFDRAQVELHEDDIYVDTRLIAAWLPLDLKLDRHSATLTVLPRIPLPLQEHWQRERLLGRLRPAEGPKSFEPWPDPYRRAEVPMVDETLQVTASNAPGTVQRLQAQSTTFMSGDLLGLSANLYANFQSGAGFSDTRMTLGRRDPRADLLGPLQATEFAFGDVLNPGLDLLALPAVGQGALVTNFPLQRAARYDRQSFQGNLPPDWQVELYRNEALLGFQASRADGRYEFLDVPLYFGWNDFRLVFYGPQGQRREEVASYNVSQNQTPQGAFEYRLVSADPTDSGRRSQFEGRYGITKQLSAGFAMSELDLLGQTHTYSQASLLGSWSMVGASLTAAKDQLGGSIAELGIRSRLGTTSLTVKHSELQDGFVSDYFLPTSGTITSRNTLETSTLLPGPGKSKVTFDLEATQDHLSTGGTMERLTNRISTSFQGYFLSNEIDLSQGRQTVVPIPTQTTGEFLASKFFPDFSVRGQADYGLSGGTHLTALSTYLETPHFEPFNLQAGITRVQASLGSPGSTVLQLGAQKTQGAYALGASLSYSTQSRLSLNLNFRLGLAREPRGGQIYSRAQGYATNGAISARTFVDTNGNGSMDPGEKPVSGIGFLVNGAPQPVATGADGVAFLTNLPADVDANLSINTTTLEDPSLHPASSGLRITPRPGHSAVIDVPLILLGEITGSAYLRRDRVSREFAGLLLELVDARGKVVKTTRTSFDGFYSLLNISPGTYQLRGSESDLRRLGLVPMPGKAIIITPEGTLIDDLDLVFETAPADTKPDTPAKDPS